MLLAVLSASCESPLETAGEIFSLEIGDVGRVSSVASFGYRCFRHECSGLRALLSVRRLIMNEKREAFHDKRTIDERDSRRGAAGLGGYCLHVRQRRQEKASRAQASYIAITSGMIFRGSVNKWRIGSESVMSRSER